MTLYSVILFTVAALILAVGIYIRRGNTKLIHDYHQTRIDPAKLPEYGRAFSKGMFVLSAALFVSGAIALYGDSKPVVIASLLVLFAGIAGSLFILVRVQKKYNGGVF